MDKEELAYRKIETALKAAGGTDAIRELEEAAFEVLHLMIPGSSAYPQRCSSGQLLSSAAGVSPVSRTSDAQVPTR